jgi:NADH:ubiquinone oxidoreductase subunit
MGAKRHDTVLLPDYIAEVGEQKFAQDYGVTVRAAQSYRFRARRPRREVARRIVEDKRNPLTWGSILDYDLYEPPTRAKVTRRGRRRA